MKSAGYHPDRLDESWAGRNRRQGTGRTIFGSRNTGRVAGRSRLRGRRADFWVTLRFVRPPKKRFENLLCLRRGGEKLPSPSRGGFPWGWVR